MKFTQSAAGLKHADRSRQRALRPIVERVESRLLMTVYDGQGIRYELNVGEHEVYQYDNLVRGLPDRRRSRPDRRRPGGAPTRWNVDNHDVYEHISGGQWALDRVRVLPDRLRPGRRPLRPEPRRPQDLSARLRRGLAGRRRLRRPDRGGRRRLPLCPEPGRPQGLRAGQRAASGPPTSPMRLRSPWIAGGSSTP